VTQFDTDSRIRVTRREALRHGLTGAAALALLGPQAQASRDGKPYGPFRMGIQSYSLRGYDFDTALEMTQKEGLHFWEAFQAHIPLTDSREKIAETLAKLKARDIKLAAWGVQGFDGNEAQARKAFDFAKMIGVQMISADPSKEAFPILDKLVAEYKINIAIHNHGPGARYDKLDSVLAAIQGHHPRIGACVDTGHTLRSGEDPVTWVKALGKRVYGVHLKDVKGTTQFTEVGQGDLRTVDLFYELNKLKFPWLVSLEYEEHEKEVGPYIDLCLAATRDAIQKAINR
jgi:inosose dehydratase